MVRTTAAFVFLLIVSWASVSTAATFRMRGDTIIMTGEILASDPLKLSRLVDRGGRTIVLQSMGGLVAAASYMAKMIRSARMTTVVEGDCASACTIMYYAGTQRVQNGRLGFHKGTDRIGTATYAAQIRRYGAPESAVKAVMATPPTRITWLR